MNKFKRWLKANKTSILIAGTFLLVAISILAIITKFVPGFWGWVMILAFILWWLSDKYFTGTQVNNPELTAVPCDSIYEYLHDSILGATNDVLKILGIHNIKVNSMKCKQENRWFHHNGHIWYRFVLICPESLCVSEYDLQMLINRELYRQVAFGNAIPVVYQAVRRGDMIQFIATTCLDETTYNALQEMIQEQAQKSSTMAGSKKDADF